MMKRVRALALIIFLAFCASAASASGLPEATATPEPLQIPARGAEPPGMICDMVDAARAEWESLNGKKLARSNKYTRPFNEGEWGWCAGFTSWCARKADVPRASLNTILHMPEDESAPVFTCYTTSPGKYLRAFQHLHRTTMIPRKGFWILYGDGANYCVHIGIVAEAELLENGKYRLTTIEGNMKNTVVMYLSDYEPVDVFNQQNGAPKSSNLTAVPAEERMLDESVNLTYRIRVSDADGSDWYVTCFLMTWIPEDNFIVVDEEELP